MKPRNILPILASVALSLCLFNTARATDPCAMYTVQAQSGSVCYLNNQPMTIGFEYNYVDGDTLVAHWGAGCAGAYGYVAKLRAYVWAYDHWAFSRSLDINLGSSCESCTRILHGWANGYCTQSYCTSSLISEYCPCGS